MTYGITNQERKMSSRWIAILQNKINYNHILYHSLYVKALNVEDAKF